MRPKHPTAAPFRLDRRTARPGAGEVASHRDPPAGGMSRPFPRPGGAAPQVGWAPPPQSHDPGGKELLEPFFAAAKGGGVVVVAPTKQAYEERLGRPVPDSTIYRLLAGHGWRKITPKRRHPKADRHAQED